MSDESMAKFTDKMMAEKVFICGLCDNLLSTPISVVKAIGNVCNDCYISNSLVGLPNPALEIILAELKIPCKFQKAGCKEHILFKDLGEHQRTCKFHTKKCLLWDDGCRWEGIQTDFAAHFVESHPSHIVSQLSNVFEIDVDLEVFAATVKLLKGKKDSYVIKIRNSGDDNCLHYAVCDARGGSTDHECVIKHIGRNSNYVETSCRLSSFCDIADGAASGAKIDLTALKQVTEAVDNVTIEVRTTNPADVKELDEKMLHFFECPVCNNLMKPPIFQCKFGHSFCNSCRPKLEKCPTCRGIFGNTRNYSLEGLTAGIFYACAYHHLGCDETLAANDTSNHEAQCIYKPYRCPLSECSFTGNHSTIISHLNNLHADQVIPTNYYKTTVDFRLEQLMDFYNYCQKYFMIFDDNIFRLSFKRNSDYSFWAVEILRKYDENATYIYDIGIIDMRRQDRKLIRTDLCFNETNTDELFKKCILFPNNILSSYASNGMFTYYCQIHKRQ